MRIVGVDPGEKNIGIAISDPTATIANPLSILKHVSRSKNAASITKIAKDNDAALVIVGQSLDLEGKPTLSGRRAARLAAEIRSQSELQVILWDESFSTLTAYNNEIKHRNKRKKLVDDIAAVVILQSFLDSQKLV